MTTPINAVLIEYMFFLRERRALAASTISPHRMRLGGFSGSFPMPISPRGLLEDFIGTIDQYIKARLPTGMARSTCRGLCNNFAVSCASSTAPEEIFTRLGVADHYTLHISARGSALDDQYRSKSHYGRRQGARKDHWPHRIPRLRVLLLLATSGLRAVEICRLRLDDIDWNAETLLDPVIRTSVLSRVFHFFRIWAQHFSRLPTPCSPSCKDRDLHPDASAPRTALFADAGIDSSCSTIWPSSVLRLNGDNATACLSSCRQRACCALTSAGTVQ